jgi:RNA polymerase sigma factor (sigma-70 family)
MHEVVASHGRPSLENVLTDLDGRDTHKPLARRNDAKYTYEAHTALLDLYLNEAKQVPPLNQEANLELIEIIHQAKKASETLLRAKNPKTKQYAHERNILQEAHKAKQKLVIGNGGLVTTVAKKYQGRGIELLELINEGAIGLIRSIPSYDRKKGAFSTHATNWITQAILRALDNKSRAIRIPVNTNTMVQRVHKAKHTLRQQLFREPTAEELSSFLDMPEEKVLDLLTISKFPISIHTPIKSDNGEDMELMDILSDITPSVEDRVETNEHQIYIQKLLFDLDSVQRRVIELLYGFHAPDGKPLTHKEVARIMNLSQEEIVATEQKAIDQLKIGTQAIKQTHDSS